MVSLRVDSNVYPSQALLSILKHRTVEKTVDKCEFSIVEGDPPGQTEDDDEEHDSLESKLIVRLHCKHGEFRFVSLVLLSQSERSSGIIKTHRLLLQTLTSLLSPGAPDATNESRLAIGPRAIKDILDHFPVVRGGKSDPQLIWNFGDSEVQVMSMETSIDASGD